MYSHIERTFVHHFPTPFHLAVAEERFDNLSPQLRLFFRGYAKDGSDLPKSPAAERRGAAAVQQRGVEALGGHLRLDRAARHAHRQHLPEALGARVGRRRAPFPRI